MCREQRAAEIYAALELPGKSVNEGKLKEIAEWNKAVIDLTEVG